MIATVLTYCVIVSSGIIDIIIGGIIDIVAVLLLLVAEEIMYYW